MTIERCIEVSSTEFEFEMRVNEGFHRVKLQDLRLGQTSLSRPLEQFLHLLHKYRAGLDFPTALRG